MPEKLNSPIIKFPDRKYKIIVIDPPWQIEKIKKKVRPNQVEMDYPMMSISDIKEMPIADLADAECTVFMWIIDKYLFEGKSILESWGFKYHLLMSWDKTNGQALYGFNRQTEFIMIGLRGKHDAYPSRPTIPTSFRAKSPYHSAKPDAFYRLLDVLEGNRIDVFARKGRDDLFGKPWDIWGNEITRDGGK